MSSATRFNTPDVIWILVRRWMIRSNNDEWFDCWKMMLRNKGKGTDDFHEKKKGIGRIRSADFQMSNCLPTHLSQMTAEMKNNVPGEFIKNMRLVFKFKVCKSVHHRTVQINHQPDATIFQFIILTFIYSATCFGRFSAHHQELNDCSGSLWFHLRIVVTVVLFSWSGRPAGPTTNTARLLPRYEGKTRGCHCSHWALDDGRKNMLNCKQTLE
jgi:hypothetical protein